MFADLMPYLLSRYFWHQEKEVKLAGVSSLKVGFVDLLEPQEAVASFFDRHLCDFVVMVAVVVKKRSCRYCRVGCLVILLQMLR